MAISLTFSALPEPFKDYAVRFDPLLHTTDWRRGFRAYVGGLLPREYNKRLTAFAGAEPAREVFTLIRQRAKDITRT